MTLFSTRSREVCIKYDESIIPVTPEFLGEDTRGKKVELHNRLDPLVQSVFETFTCPTEVCI